MPVINKYVKYEAYKKTNSDTYIYEVRTNIPFSYPSLSVTIIRPDIIAALEEALDFIIEKLNYFKRYPTQHIDDYIDGHNPVDILDQCMTDVNREIDLAKYYFRSHKTCNCCNQNIED